MGVEQNRPGLSIYAVGYKIPVKKDAVTLACLLTRYRYEIAPARPQVIPGGYDLRPSHCARVGHNIGRSVYLPWGQVKWFAVFNTYKTVHIRSC